MAKAQHGTPEELREEEVILYGDFLAILERLGAMKCPSAEDRWIYDGVTIRRVVAFPSMPTRPQDDKWRDIAAEIAGLLTQLRIHEARNGRPEGEDWPEIFAALKALNQGWNEAIAEILAGYAGRFVTANEVFRKMAHSKPVDEPITLEKVRSWLSEGARQRLWRKERDGARVRYAANLPTETTVEAAPAEA